jgi:hypothetical protein
MTKFTPDTVPAKINPQKHAEAVREGIRAAQGVQARRAMITQHLISELNAVDPVAQMSKARLMVMRLVEMAIAPAPDLVAIREIYDRVEGKARQQVDVSHDGDVTVRSAAISALDELIEEVTRRKSAGAGKDTLPN